MIRSRSKRLLGAVVLVMALAAAALAGCGTSSTGSTTPKVATGSTAMGSLPVAKAALSTTAPDAVLLVVQTAQAVSTTGTPVWGYLLGSPKTDKTYVVYVAGGKSMGVQEYGKSGLKADEWKQIPSTDKVKIDSDVAVKNALKASGARGVPNAYMIGMLMYKPKTDTSTVEPMVWQVQFDPGKSGATSDNITVNAETGATAVVKKK